MKLTDNLPNPLQRSKTIIRQRKTRRQMAFLTLASAVCLVLIVAVALGMSKGRLRTDEQGRAALFATRGEYELVVDGKAVTFALGKGDTDVRLTV